MKRFLISLFTILVVASCLFGCRDENDPEYWLSQMYDRPWREKSLKTLNKIFNSRMQDNNNDLDNPAVKEVVDVMVPELVKGFKEFTRDKFNRTEIIKLLAQMKDERAIEVFMMGLDLENTSDSMMFQVSANALRRQNVEASIPKLLEAHNTVVAARNRRPGAPFTNSENEIEQAVISATSSIISKSPGSVHKAKVVKMLCDVAETTDEFQELRLNMKALKGLGKIGDKSAIPTLIKGIAMKGKRQPIGLGQIAFASLQQIHDRDAVAKAIITFAKGEDQQFNEFYKEERTYDILLKNPNWYRQEATTFLGAFNYSSPEVIKFLESELQHTEPDQTDIAASEIKDLPVNFEPSGWASMRRNWAAVSLGQLAHKPLLAVAKSRLSSGTSPEEAVGYVRALGYLLYPAESCDTMLNLSNSADDSLRDKIFYNAALMCGKSFVDAMNRAEKKINCQKIIKERFPDGGSDKDIQQAQNECDIMKKRIQGYMARIEYGEKCGNDVDCYLKTVADHTNANVERAIYSAYRLARDDDSKRQKVVEALTKNLHNPSKVAMTAAVFALDHLTPQGGKELEARIQEVWGNFSRQSTYKDRARLLEAFIGHVRARSRSK